MDNAMVDIQTAAEGLTFTQIQTLQTIMLEGMVELSSGLDPSTIM